MRARARSSFRERRCFAWIAPMCVSSSLTHTLPRIISPVCLFLTLFLVCWDMQHTADHQFVCLCVSRRRTVFTNGVSASCGRGSRRSSNRSGKGCRNTLAGNAKMTVRARTHSRRYARTILDVGETGAHSRGPDRNGPMSDGLLDGTNYSRLRHRFS